MNRQTIRARIAYQDLEGGFWGLVSTSGEKYVPVEPLPKDLREDGLEVDVTLEPAHVLGTAMWGKYIKILDISPCS